MIYGFGKKVRHGPAGAAKPEYDIETFFLSLIMKEEEFLGTFPFQGVVSEFSDPSFIRLCFEA